MKAGDRPEKSQQKEDQPSTMELYRDHQMTPSKVRTEDHNLQEILDRENLDIYKFLDQGTTEWVDSLAQEEFDRVQQLFLWRSQANGSEIKRNHDSQENRGLKKMEATSGHGPKNPGRKRGRKRQNGLLIECGKLMINSDKMKDLTGYPFTNLS